MSEASDALKRDLPLHCTMGLEMIGLLVHAPTLDHLLGLTWGELRAHMEAGSLRDLRPVQDNRLTVTFAIDAEAEWLDWMEQQEGDETGPVLDVLSSCKNGEEGLLYLMKWASPGFWEVWEGRAFLYLEEAIGREASDIHELYTASLWGEVSQRLRGLSEDEFSQRVVMNWMQRRVELGETIEESEDPKIVPTFEAHTRASKTLVYTVNRAERDDDLVLIIGREHLEASKWGHGEWNLSARLHP